MVNEGSALFALFPNKVCMNGRGQGIQESEIRSQNEEKSQKKFLLTFILQVLWLLTSDS